MCRPASRSRRASRISRGWRSFSRTRAPHSSVGLSMATATQPEPIYGRRDPDARGYFGQYGGRFVPETLVAPIEELTAGYFAARADDAFCEELDRLLKHYVGRPTPLYEARNLPRADEAGRVGRVLPDP